MANELDAGDWAGNGFTYKAETDGTVGQGDLVKYNSNGRLTQTTTSGDEYVGVMNTSGETTSGAGVTVAFMGRVYVRADGSVSEGDWLEPSGSTSGSVQTDPDPDTANRKMFALDDATDGDSFEAHLS